MGGGKGKGQCFRGTGALSPIPLLPCVLTCRKPIFSPGRWTKCCWKGNEWKWALGKFMAWVSSSSEIFEEKLLYSSSQYPKAEPGPWSTFWNDGHSPCITHGCRGEERAGKLKMLVCAGYFLPRSAKSFKRGADSDHMPARWQATWKETLLGQGKGLACTLQAKLAASPMILSSAGLRKPVASVWTIEGAKGQLSWYIDKTGAPHLCQAQSIKNK